LIHIKFPNDLSGTIFDNAVSRSMRNFAPRGAAYALVFCLAAISLGCGRSDKSEAGARHYEARGIVRGFSPDRSTIDIEHEAIAGFMPSMTMPFTPRDPKDIVHLTLRDAIAFRIEVTGKEALIDNIRKIAASEVHLPPASSTVSPRTTKASSRLKECDAMPVFGLTNESGERISLDTYRGKPFVITFIFTRCPMPNFCPRMSKNFAELQSTIKNSGGKFAETKLLSITIDPQNDTPAVLKDYGKAEGADPKIWNFGTGNPSEIEELTRVFGVYTERAGGSISHGLTTALIDGQGHIVKLWRGNGWTPREVIEALVP
jgi:protein SCO1